MKMKKYYAIILLAALILSACSGGAAGKEIPNLDGTEWTMVKLKGQDAVASTTVWIGFNGDQIDGSGGCNGIGGEVTKDMDGNIKFGMLISTLMWCEADGISDQEIAYMQALDEARTYHVSGGNLFMENENGEVILEYTPKSE
jgi:heat shock protein HslJ